MPLKAGIRSVTSDTASIMFVAVSMAVCRQVSLTFGNPGYDAQKRLVVCFGGPSRKVGSTCLLK